MARGRGPLYLRVPGTAARRGLPHLRLVNRTMAFFLHRLESHREPPPRNARIFRFSSSYMSNVVTFLGVGAGPGMAGASRFPPDAFVDFVAPTFHFSNFSFSFVRRYSVVQACSSIFKSSYSVGGGGGSGLSPDYSRISPGSGIPAFNSSIRPASSSGASRIRSSSAIARVQYARASRIAG